MRRSREALVGLVGRRGTGATAAWRMSSISRSRASWRLRSWVRWRCAVMTSTPSRVRRLPAKRSSRVRTSSVSDSECRTSKRICTALASLLTFCPPGPEARMKLSSSSPSSMLMQSVMRIMGDRSPDHRRAKSGLAGGRLAPGQIALRQHLAFLDRRLVERVDVEEARGDDRLQHEMHQQFAEACLVEPLDVDGAHRAAVLGERLSGGAALRGDEIADGLAGEVRLAREPREVGRDP